MLPDFTATVGALAATVAEREQGAGGSPQAARDFVLASFAAMPGYLRPPLRAATLFFDAWPLPRRGRFFHALSPAERRAQMEAWEAGPAHMLMRFYVSLALVSLWHE
ncbi:hypothetical protein [Sphingobium estronivorans]|uniref:hypothetical protein n=1 Tax=Sphingobium estronivorans TaxID=1577690 RepID=UPI00123A0021|nr:hypothetical protein [Sphingobium estronivorans]